MAFRDYYRILGVRPGSDTRKIKEAYRRKASASHPDKHPGSDPDASGFIEIKEAYDVLGNPERRREYDIEYENRQRTTVRDTDPYSGHISFNTPEDPLERLFENLFRRLTGRGLTDVKRYGRHDEGPRHIHYDDLL